MKLKLFLIIITMCLANSAWAATYYIAPNGRNSNDGTSPSSPWLTFSHALNSARAWCGDTLVLLNGTYGDGTSTGKINLQGANCSAGSILTIKAQNQRQAKIVDSGQGVAVTVSNSSYINVEGLHFTSSNYGSSGIISASGRPLEIRRSNNITIRGNLGKSPNKYANAHIYAIMHSRNILLEDNESYDFHRHCVMAWGCEKVVVRRHYCHPRIGGIPGGLGQATTRGSTVRGGGAGEGTGDTLFSMYPCKDCILENSIADGNMALSEMNSEFIGSTLMSGSKILGSICNGCSLGNGIYLNSRITQDLNHTPQNILIENVAIVDFKSKSSAIRASDGVNIAIQNLTVTGAGGVTGITADDGVNGATPSQQSIRIYDSTVQGLTGRGFNKAPNAYNTWRGNNLNSYNNGTLFSPGLPGNWGRVSTSNPGLGSCKVFIPEGSPMKGAGTDGGDIGANILCRYENGVLTNQQLWNWQTGEFPCGAIVPGVNDIPGQSCFDVHKRLNVNTNGCSLPANPSCKQPSGIGFGDSGATSAGTPPPCCI